MHGPLTWQILLCPLAGHVPCDLQLASGLELGQDGAVPEAISTSVSLVLRPAWLGWKGQDLVTVRDGAAAGPGWTLLNSPCEAGPRQRPCTSGRSMGLEMLAGKPSSAPWQLCAVGVTVCTSQETLAPCRWKATLWAASVLLAAIYW